jgi:hypothetical protein
MKSLVSKITRCMPVFGLALAFAAATWAASEPTPTATPRPGGGKSLTEVAKDKKLNTDAAGTSDGSIVITNENLQEYASKGQVTEAKPSVNREAVGPNAPGIQMVDPKEQQALQRKYYWQGKYVQQLSMIQSLRRQIQQLDADIPGLWNDFFSRDDPAYRDGVVKPKLDQSLDRRKELEEQLAAAEPMLEQIKIDARKDGAEPGWFRELGLKKFQPREDKEPERVIEAVP